MITTNNTLLLLMFVFHSCNGNNNNIPKNNDSLISYKDTREYPSAQIQEKGILLDDKSEVEIISAFKEYAYDSTSENLIINQKKCEKWILVKLDILKIFKSSKPISGTEWDLSYETLPCYYKGVVRIGNKRLDYKLNAASYIVLMYEGNTTYLGCTSKSMRKYFISHPQE